MHDTHDLHEPPAGEPLDRALRMAFARTPRAADAPARYEDVEAIGRGGMGVVHRAHEPRLGRDLAIKTLRPELADDPEMVRRFLREARILASLDHPAIVAVHELGTTPDGLPYLAMRLIRGESLEDLLARRKDPSEDRPRFLHVFQSVCQAAAHAHEQGVIHRDLKPANVMIGPHGDVQVVDWGLARRVTSPPLSTSRVTPAAQESRPPITVSPLGTPAYMAPEQARADDGVGFQADVFGLGSILCEILTGLPPRGGTPVEALRSAAAGDSAEALARLHASDAHPALKELAARCLGADPAQRPADAGRVRAEFDACLERIDCEARQAQLDAATARTVAQEERKRRRLTMVLSSVIFALAALGTVLWAGAVSERSDRSDRAALAVDQALGAAAALRVEARAAPHDDEAAWQRALDASSNALQLAQSPDAPVVWRRRAETELELVQEGLRGARTRATERKALADATSELAEARTLRMTDCGLSSCSAAYQAFLTDRGLGDLQLPAAEVARIVKDAGDVGPLLTAALDEWAEVCSRLRCGQGPDVADVARLAAAADPDAWRNALRRTITEGDAAALRDLLGAVDPRGLEERSLALAALWIDTDGRAEQGELWYEIAALRFPGNPWIHHMAALDHLRHERPAAAAASWRAALALKPEVPAIWRGLAAALVDVDAAEAAEVCRLAIGKGMKCSKLWIELGRARAALGETDEALAALRRASELSRPHDPEPFVHLGDVQARVGHLAEALASYEEALRRDANSVRAHVGLAEVFSATGDKQAAGTHLAAASSSICRLADAGIEARIARLGRAGLPADGGE
ncbi:MAG: protein kinase [Planctomycetes bacterium]|nr:protein kinase [Planctomycetota bacterium]MCB9825321.1 protein kinase [Planctomycetota bacterium]MCB9900807.1 protein kinase [Planctomycetota bacterium]